MSRPVRSSLPIRIGAALALFAAVLTVGPAARAAKPVHVSFPVDISYEIPELTEGCGVPVWFHLEGIFKGTLTRNKSGVITGEFDSQPNTTQTFSSPETGRSFSFKFATTFHNKYPDGVDPGDRVIATATGFMEKIPGIPARAGRTYFPDGEVLFLDDGVPIVDYGEPSFSTKGVYSYDFEEADAAICAYLSAR